MASTLNFRDVHGLILRQVKYLVTLLLVLSAFAATTAQSNIFTPAGPLVPPVNAALTITVTLSPGTGDPGIHVAVNSTTSLVDSTSPTGFDTACSISSPSTDQNGHSPIDPGTEACIVNSSHMAEGSFTIGNVLPGQYVIEVTSCPGNTGCTPSQTPPGDYGQAVLNVVSGPSIKLSPTTGAPGAHVLVNGTGFLPSDTTCALGAPGSNAIEPGTQACAISPGSGKVNASFTINNVSPGQYVIMVTAYPGGDSAQALLNVVSGPAIRLYPTTGQPGAHVVVNGTGFLPTDTTCALGAPGSNAVLPGTQACVIHQGSGVVNGSFTIGNVSPGQYVIMVTAYPGGDSAQALLNVVSGPAIRLYPTTGQPGAHVVVNGTGFQPTDTSCSISSSSVDVYGHSPIFPGTSGCVVHAGSGVVNGSFTVGNVLPGQYVIEITGCGGNNGCAPSVGDFAQALLNVVSGPAIRLYPTTGQPGAHVVVNGTGFLPTDTFCGIGAPGSNAVLPGTQACVVHAGSGVVNGSFTIGNVSPGQYVIQIQAGPGNDVAQALLNVVSGPSIRVYPVACGATGATGGCEAGAHVSVNGTGFLPTDATCALGAPGSNVIEAGTQACAIHQGSGVVNASFTIGNVLPGQYVIMITGYGGGDSAQAIVNVVSGPSIRVYPVACGATGTTGGCEAGAHVSVNGTGFLPTDTTCALGAPGSNAIEPGTQACVIEVGSGIVNASFTINSVSPGQYVIQITGYAGGDSAQAIVNVVSGPSIRVYPVICRSTGTGCAPGAHILVNGTGFLPTDATCALGAPGSGVVEAGTQACVIEVGSGIVNASFTIGNVTPGQYVIQITGYGGGDSAQAIVYVINGPRLTLTNLSNPGGPAMIGQEIGVNGSGFLPTDQSCSISGIGNGNVYNPVLTGSAGCAIAVGTGVVNGSFIIGNVSPGQYVIEVTGCQGNNGCAPSVGDFAQAVLRVFSSGSTLTLSATNSSEESTVTFFGTGLSPSDTGCMLLAYNHATNTLDTNLITSPTCSITSPGVAQGTFIVSPYATTNIPWNLTVRGTPAQDLTPFAIFNVTADVIVTPTSGTVNTVFTFTGSGFSGTADTCTATIYPPFPVIPSTTGITLVSTGASTTTTAVGTSITTLQVETSTQAGAGCYVSTGIGQVSGSVIVPTSAVPGTYGIVVTAVSAAGYANSATGVFTVGTPSALVVLNPASVEQGQPVGAAGFGFNPSDAYCTVSSSTGSALFASTPTCQISGGYASAAFTVSPVASGGYYLISIIGCEVQPSGNVCPAGATLDFASNFLGVTLATTITTYSTTTSTSSTTTSLSTTTTSVATSFSYSSTTWQTTGILYTTFSHFVVTTVSGVSSTTYSQTSYTTQTHTTVTYSTTTQFTTVPCGPLPCGFSTQPAPFNPAPGIDSAGLLAALLLLIPMLLRRLFT